MDTLKHVLRAHWGALALALLLALLSVAPPVAFRVQHADDGIYHGIEILPEDPWLPRVREIMDGHGFGSIYFKEGKGDPYLFQPAGSMTVAYMGKALGLDINNTILLSKCVLPFITFLLLYAFVYLFAREKLIALAVSSVLLLADSVTSLSSLTKLLNGVSPSGFLSLGIPVNPAMIYLLLFAALTAFWLFYTRGTWYWWLAAVLTLGANFYNYFYTWTYLFAFLGVLGLIQLARRNWQDVFRIASVGLGAIVVAIPYAINLYEASKYPAFYDVGIRQGILYTHEPLFVGVVVVAALIFVAAFFPRGDTKRYAAALALLIAPFITLNQQLLTGKKMQTGHYHWYFHKPLAIALVLITVFYLLHRYGRPWMVRTLAALVIVCSFGVGIFVQVDSYLHHRTDGGEVAIDRQRYGPVMDWLNANAEKDEVLLGNRETAMIALIYTPLNAFYHHGDLYSLSATNERLHDILLTLFRLQGVSATSAPALFAGEERAFVSLNLYGIHYRDLNGTYESIPDEEVNAFTERYLESLKTPTNTWLKDMFTKYDVSWVVWDREADPEWLLDRYPFLKKQETFGNLVIYRVEQ